MNYVGLNTCDTANGPGLRVSLFVAGCRLKCKGCFNKSSWNFKAGKKYTRETEEEILKALVDPYIEGLSILGGEPFEPENVDTLITLCKKVNKPIWIWSGYYYNQIKHMKLLDYVDVLVEGPYIKERTVSSKWYGSDNQQIRYLRKNNETHSTSVNK